MREIKNFIFHNVKIDFWKFLFLKIFIFQKIQYTYVYIFVYEEIIFFYFS